jgi:putative flippase GtrA
MIRRSGADLPLLLRFVGVGASCALVYFSLCYAFQVQLGWSSFGATAVAYACSFGVGYSGQRLLTFRSTVAHRVSLSRYATLHVGGAVTDLSDNRVGWQVAGHRAALQRGDLHNFGWGSEFPD